MHRRATALSLVRKNGRVRVVTAGCGSAGQESESGWRIALAVRASRRELRRGDTEESGQLLDFIGPEVPLPVVAVAFGGAHGGGARPAQQFAELRRYVSPQTRRRLDLMNTRLAGRLCGTWPGVASCGSPQTY